MTVAPAPLMLDVRDLAKTFVLHTQGGVRLPVFTGLDLQVRAGECVVLGGPSGAGKSTLLRSLFANYKPTSGSVRVRHAGRMLELNTAAPRAVLQVRRVTIGYVSQFLRVIPRVAAIDIVADTLRAQGHEREPAAARAGAMLMRLNLPRRLWSLPPATFSGGEQQRVNIARSFVRDYPLLLIDEPTASLDVDNRRVVIELINEAKTRGTAVVGIFHDAEVRDAVGSRVFDLARYAAAA